MDNEEIVEKQEEVKEEVTKQEEVKEEVTKETVSEAKEEQNENAEEPQVGEKKINFSAALKEKNMKIQELKRQLKEAQELNDRLIELGFGDTAEAENNTAEVKKLMDSLQQKEKELEELKKFKEDYEKNTIVKKAEIELENELSRLEKKYPNFDRLKVMGRVVAKKGNAAILSDLEEAFLAMKYEEEILKKQSEEAVTEGSSIAGVKPSTTNPSNYDDAIEQWLKKSKGG